MWKSSHILCLQTSTWSIHYGFGPEFAWENLETDFLGHEFKVGKTEKKITKL